MDTKAVETGTGSGPLDHDYLNRNYIQLGCADVLKDVIDIFLESSPEKLACIKQAAGSGELTVLTKCAHGMKGESGSVGARIVNRLAAAIEQAARKDDIEGVRCLIPELETELQRAADALKRDYKA